jgi:hypothetical protein
MLLRFHRLGAALFLIFFGYAGASAEEGTKIWDTTITRSWLDDHVAAARRAPRRNSSYRLARTRMWANGITRSGMRAFMPTEPDHSLGAELQPFRDLNFTIGTELIRSGEDHRLLDSRGSWQAFWSHDWKGLGDLTLDLSTTGSADTLQASYLQELNGSLGIPLDLPVGRWRTELRLSPSMSLDMSNGIVGAGLMSEVMGRTVLGSRDDPFRSILNVTLGYGLAPDSRPVAAAKLEISITPNL